MCKLNKWQYLPRDHWFLKWKALGASSGLYASSDWDSITSPSADFGRLRTSYNHVVFKNPSTPRIKISAYISEKVGRYILHDKLYYAAGHSICHSNWPLNCHWMNVLMNCLDLSICKFLKCFRDTLHDSTQIFDQLKWVILFVKFEWGEVNLLNLLPKGLIL